MKTAIGPIPPVRAALDSVALLVCTIMFVALLPGQSRGGSDVQYRTEEISIAAGDFTIVGDLYIPARGDKHPLVVWVHGSGPLTRGIVAPLIAPQIEVFLGAGFAFFIDDIPGAGSSKGVIRKVYRDRAMILCKEVEALKSRPDIIPDQVGVAGHSQAGVVMPLALKDSCGIAFMIAEACPAECALEQEAYLFEKLMICEGYPPEEARAARHLHLKRCSAESYKDYREAAEYLNNHPVAQLLQINDPLVEESEFTPPRKSSGLFLDPMPILAGTTIPVLAIFGEKDNNVDPVQGAEAYEKTLKAAGNSFYRVETIPGANHMLYATETGCAREILEQVQAGKPDYVPATLTVLASWLEDLKKHIREKGRPTSATAGAPGSW